jgi:hypothetical protein
VIDTPEDWSSERKTTEFLDDWEDKSRYVLNVVTHPKIFAIRWMPLTIAYPWELNGGQFSGEGCII